MRQVCSMHWPKRLAPKVSMVNQVFERAKAAREIGTEIARPGVARREAARRARQIGGVGREGALMGRLSRTRKKPAS